MNSQVEMFEGLENDYFKNYNVGNEISNKKREVETDVTSEYSNLTLKNIDEKDFHNNELEEIKSFFAKE